MDEPPKNRFSWWERRTRIEKCLIVACSLCAIVILYLASNLLMKFPSNSEHLKQEICLTPKCIRSAASILEKIDRKIDPCDDFYKFACGNFIKNARIPGEKVSVSSYSDMGEKIGSQLLKVCEEPIAESDHSSIKLIKSLYKSCMNTTQIDTESLDFVKNEFKILGGWPVVDVYWNEKLFDWKSLLYRLQRLGWIRTLLFSMFIEADLKNSSKQIFTISDPCLPTEMLKKDLNDSSVKAMYDLSVELATLFGADRTVALADMLDVLNFRKSLAKIIVPSSERKNLTSEYNPTTIRELQKNITSIPWLKLINNFLSPIDMLTSDDVINVAAPKFFQQFENLMLKTKKRTLANYMFLTVLRSWVKHLPEEFRKVEAKYYKVLSGKQEETPRWKQCVMETTRMNVAVSSIYVQRFFDKTVKSKVNELNLDIKFSFLETLRKIGWMDRKTKKHALLKAEDMKSMIAYPEEILDDSNIEEYYRGLELNPNEYYLKQTFNLSKFWHMKHVQKLREPVQKNDWKLQAYTFYVNAFYHPVLNTIELPAAILQEHFYDPSRPQYLNYGSIGEVIGHEITHGFDNLGRQYDKDGNLVDWWEPETNRTFARKSQCLVEQYKNYTIPEIEMSVDGERTLGENIADNGGIKIAYRGYLRWVERNKAEPALPGLPYSPRQMFWISAATNRCTKYTKESLKQMVSSASHAPNYFRVMVPFLNSDHFGRDFNCPLGSPMNPKYKCRVW